MIVTRAPDSNMAASSLHEIDVVYEVFKKAAPTTRIASVLEVRSFHPFPWRSLTQYLGTHREGMAQKPRECPPPPLGVYLAQSRA